MSSSTSLIAIELYGQGLRISDGKQLLATSPSFALIEADQIQVGTAAEQQAHLRPREISTKFWHDLSGQSSTKHVVSHAQIAFTHLQSIWEKVDQQKTKAVFICPANLDKNQLGLLLGICKKIGIDVSAIASNATFSISQRTNASTTVFLDLLQNKIVLTEVLQNNSEISLKQPSRVLDYGLEDFINNCAKIIAEKFITETRFDPFHSADHEQQFYDKLKQWLNNLTRQNSIECVLVVGDKEYAVVVDAHELSSANQHLFSELSNYLNVLFHHQDTLGIICSSNTADAFGLHEYLGDMPGCASILLTDLNIVENALNRTTSFNTGDEIHFVTSLTWQTDSLTNLSFNSGSLSNLVSMPTHLLVSGHAYPLNKDLFISASEDSLDFIISYEQTSKSIARLYAANSGTRIQVFNGYTITLNNQSIDSASSLKINDVLSISDSVVSGQLIKVVQYEA